MNDQYVIVWYIIVFIAILIFLAMREGRDKAKIIKFLEREGCWEIKVTRNLSTTMNGMVIFEVEYRPDNGELRKNACVIVARPFSEDRFFWEKPAQ